MRENLIAQQGLRELLLCEKCEAQLSRYEKYVRELLYGGVELWSEESRMGGLIYPIDYDRLKLFALSLLLRMSLSQHEFFREVKLHDHEQRLREMILSETPGRDNEYPFFVIGLIGDDGAAMDDFIMSPDTVQAFGVHVLRLAMGGFAWAFVLSEEMKETPFWPLVVKKGEKLLLPRLHYRQMEMLTIPMQELLSLGRVRDAAEHFEKQKRWRKE